LSNIIQEQNLKFPVVTIMFDDGFSSVYNEAFPMLESFGYPANVATNGSAIDKSGFLAEQQLKELLNKGWALSDHTYSHINCKGSDEKKIEYEIMANRKVVYDLFRYRFRDFVFPKSRVSDLSLNKILSYYPIVFTGTTRIMGERIPLEHRLLNRTEISTYERILYRLRFSVFLKELRQYLADLSSGKKSEWLILFTHKVADKPGFFDTSRNDFGQILDSIHSAGIPVKTTSDVVSASSLEIGSK
jgi:peptidoglycan/xylan/chitin deacetylase (PgdA/CDA1 family)